MAMTKPLAFSAQLYLNQWLKTATGGNVVAQNSLLKNKTSFVCTKCLSAMVLENAAMVLENDQLTPPPNGVLTIDYGLQQFVNTHAHNPGYGPSAQASYVDVMKVPEVASEKVVAIDSCVDWKNNSGNTVSIGGVGGISYEWVPYTLKTYGDYGGVTIVPSVPIPHIPKESKEKPKETPREKALKPKTGRRFR